MHFSHSCPRRGLNIAKSAVRKCSFSGMLLDRVLASEYKADILVRVNSFPGGLTTMAEVTGNVSVETIKITKYKRKKKRGSSRSSRRLTDLENRATKSLRRVSKAVDRGVQTYRSKRKKSQRRRRDGALVDSYENAAVGIAESVANSSPVLTDLAKAINTRRRRKSIRRLVRSFPIPR